MHKHDFYLSDTECTQADVDLLWDTLCTNEHVERVLEQTYKNRFCLFVDEITRFLLGSQEWRDEPKAWEWLYSHGRWDYFNTFGREATDDEWLTLFRWEPSVALPTATKTRIEKLSREELVELEAYLNRQDPRLHNKNRTALLGWISEAVAALED